MNVLPNGSLCQSFVSDHIVTKGSVGIVVRVDFNGFLNKESFFIVWESEQFAEYFASDVGVDFRILGLNSNIVESMDFSLDSMIIENIKNGFFKSLFKDLKSRKQLQDILK